MAWVPSPIRRHAYRARDQGMSAIQAWLIWPVRFRVALLRLWGVDCAWQADIVPHTYFDSPDVTLGRCFVNRDVGFYPIKGATIRIEDGCAIGMGTQFITNHHDVGPHENRAGIDTGRSIVVETGCWLGAGVLVLPGVTIGAGCVVAAGAVITGDCAPDGLYAGVPARRVRDLSPD